MATIFVKLPENTTTARGFGREASTVTRVLTGTPGAIRMELWLREGDREPLLGEVVGTFRNGNTLYACGVQR